MLVTPEGDQSTVMVRIDMLRRGDSPRSAGLDETHISLLAEAGVALPPILVHRDTMCVVDGLHRLRAAELRGSEQIEVQFFDGTETEAFVLAVRANTTHGLPLSLADRKAAALRIVDSHPQWSDRRIAAVSGLARRTVADLRARASGEVGQLNTRVGLDGRTRPLSSADGRRQAARIYEQRPDASLREVASATGISVGTVRDVRDRVRNGEDPVPFRTLRHGDASVTSQIGLVEAPKAVDEPPSEHDWSTIFQQLTRDPTLRLTDQGRRLLRWLNINAVPRKDRAEFLGAVPAYSADMVADLARSYAEMWREFADELDRRGRNVS